MQDNLKLRSLKDSLSGHSVSENLKLLAGIFTGKIVFTTSFGAEDQVITHYIFSEKIPVSVSTLDTGRLFRETYDTFSNTIIRYRNRIEVYCPERDDVEKLLTEKGPYSFYESAVNRKECCHIRKIIPLNRALNGVECWISGIRAEQSDNRAGMEQIEFDKDRNLFKFYPLFSWSFEDVTRFLKENNVPYNRLHDKGFVSIGCEPCTRAISPGEDFRAGRWWWESGKKECGLHERR